MLKDFEYALRALQRSPGFAAAAILSLALGLGANTALFSAVDAVLLRPLPYREPDRLMLLWTSMPGTYPTTPSSLPDLKAYREETRSFEAVAGYFTTERNLSVPGAAAERLTVERTTADLPRALGVGPQEGRYFDASEEAFGNHRVIVISRRLATRLGAHPGTALLLDGEPFNVIGVMPASFSFDEAAADVWMPIAYPPKNDLLTRSNHFVYAVARLKPGVTPEAARADLQRVAAAMAVTFPENAGMSATLQPLREALSGDLRPALLLLLGAVGLVLLIACVNLANLLLARGAARSREIAVRAALGATRGRLVRQLLGESVLISLIGGALGCALALWALAGLPALAGGQLAQLPPLQLDLRVLGFALLLSVATGLAFGLLPALLLSRHTLSDALRASAPALSPRSGRLRSGLVVAEVALSVLLLAGAGLLIRSLFALQRVDPGFRADHLLTASIALPRARYDSQEKQLAFFREALSRARALPGVAVAGVSSGVPLDQHGWGKYLWAEGNEPGRLEDVPGCDFYLVGGDYLRALGVTLRRGHLLDDPKQPEVVINETAAKVLFGSADPLGRQVSIDPPERLLPPDRNGPRYPRFTVAGVVRDVRAQGPQKPVRPQVWMRHEQLDQAGSMYFALRFEGEGAGLAQALRGVVASLDGSVALSDVKSMDQRLGVAMSRERFSALLLSLFAGLALALAMLGVYAVMAYSVAQRTREIGVRMALGAAAGDVLRLVLLQGSGLVALGLGIGVAAALATSRALAALLFGVSAADPATYVAVAAIQAAVAALALYLPARRASRLHPSVALRAE